VSSVVEKLGAVCGPDRVLTDEKTRALCSADCYSAGELCAAVVRPATKAQAAEALRICTSAGYTVVARGAGLTYTGNYPQDKPGAIVFDMSDLRNLVVYPEDRILVAEAGCTWLQIDQELRKHNLRLPCFGTHSGARATVGGGLSVGALFWGTARYGLVADSLMGLEVALADGTVVTTGQAALQNVKVPAYRTYGPDLTGPFVHDCGALGLKLSATFRLINRPAHTGFASFLFDDILTASKALSAVAQSEACEEAYVLDPSSTKRGLAEVDLRRGLATLASTVREGGSLFKGIANAARIVRAGKEFGAERGFSLHIVAAARSEAALAADLQICRDIALAHGAVEIPASIPTAMRAAPFQPLNIVLGPEGERFVAVNAKVPHTEALDMVVGGEEILKRYEEAMAAHGIRASRMLTALSNYSFSYEPLLHWSDEWLPIHREVPDPAHLAKLKQPAANPEARRLVDQIRSEIVAYFASRGAASNQIGRTYHYMENLKPETAAFLKGIKQLVDPKHQINPGVMGL
jgi:FAD/FMN-containing dehydrogenase